MAVTGWTGWEPQERAVLVFVRREDDLLLIHKKRGLGTGKVNGPGGRLEAGETWEQAAIRETREETGVEAGALTEAADLKFQFTSGYRLQARVFLADQWQGTLQACEEADPFWHPAAGLPWGSMWTDDALWLPSVLAGRRVEGRFVFDGEAMVEAQLTVFRRPSAPFAG